MNKKTILGISLLIIGNILMFTIDNDLTSFFGGVLIGSGAAVAVIGKKN